MGLRFLFLLGFSLLSVILLPRCSQEIPPPAGQMRASDPAADAIFQKGKTYEASGNFKKAYKQYEQIVNTRKLSPIAPEAQMQAAFCHERLGEYKEAFAGYDKLVTSYPNSGLYEQAMESQARIAFGYSSGTIKSKFLGMKSSIDTEKASEMLKKVRTNGPSLPSAPLALYNLGALLESRNDFLAAAGVYQELVDAYPSSIYAPEGQYRIGKSQLAAASSGNYDQANLHSAKVAFEKFLQNYSSHPLAPKVRQDLASLKEKDAKSSYEIGEFYLKKKNPQAAAFYYQEALKNQNDPKILKAAQKRLKQLGVR